MTLDLLTMTVTTGVVVVVAGVMYLLETLLRKDGAAGRIWSIAFLSGIGTVAAYLLWIVQSDSLVPVALGNAGFVAVAGFIWLGCCAFNQRRLMVRSLVVGVVVATAAVSVFLEGPEAGWWAGAGPQFLGIALFAALGAVETRIGRLAKRPDSYGLTVVLGIEACFFAARLAGFVAFGPGHEVFRTWLGSEATSLLTCAMTVVTVITTSVLRASESNLRGYRDTYELRLTLDGVMLPRSFEVAASALVAGAQQRDETLCLIAVRIDDLRTLGVAFGPAEAEAIAAAWRAGVRRYAPTASIVGERGRRTLLIAFITTSFSDVRRLAADVHRRLLDDFGALDTSVLPTVGVGIALTDQVGYDLTRLADAAGAAAEQSMASTDTSVVVAGR